MKLPGVVLMVTCAALAQAPDLKSASGYPKMVQKQVTAWIERAAEKMPEEEYAFKPDPAVRSFGQSLATSLMRTISSVRPFWEKTILRQVSRKAKRRRRN